MTGSATVAIETFDKNIPCIKVYRVNNGGSPLLLGRELVSICFNESIAFNWLNIKYQRASKNLISTYNSRTKIKYNTDFTYIMANDGRWYIFSHIDKTGVPYVVDLYSYLSGKPFNFIAYV